MTELLYKIANMSISASILVLVVLVLRLVLQKAPKWVSVLLWGLVAIRLICPFSVESTCSLMPGTDWIQEQAYVSDSILPDTLSAFSSSGENSASVSPQDEPVITIKKNPNYAVLIPYFLGAAGMMGYMLVSYLCMYRRIRTAEHFHANIYRTLHVPSPVVFGIIRPRIYLPADMNETGMAYVIAHEQAHIRRRDHWWKPLGFFLLTIHWFNPILWIAYMLLCRDIEMACDEKVIRDMGDEERADYSQALLECSVSRRMISACPLAFGEIGVKTRIKSVLHYKKPAFWLMVFAGIVFAAAAVCFLTNPIMIRNPWVQEYVPGAEGILGNVDKEKYERVSSDFAIGADKYGRAVFKDPKKAFNTMKDLYSEGLELIRREQSLAPIAQNNYELYKKFGWQMTAGSDEAKKQASFISGFLDIYENSFSKDKPNSNMPAPTMEGEITDGRIIAGNISAESLEVEIEDSPETMPEAAEMLTLEEVAALSLKGHDLTWSDFARYVHTDVGSGLYIWHFEIDETFSLKIGGGSTRTVPMYIHLSAKRGEEENSIDIRNGGVEEFVQEYTSSDDFILSVIFASERSLSGMEYHEHIVTQSEYTQLLLLRAQETLSDIRFTAMDYTVEGFRVLKELYTLDKLTTDKPLVIGVVFPGDLTTYGISFTDSAGSAHQCLIYISGRDGTPVIQEYTPSR